MSNDPSAQAFLMLRITWLGGVIVSLLLGALTLARLASAHTEPQEVHS